MTFVPKAQRELPASAKDLERRVRDCGATPFFHKFLTQSDLVPNRGVQVSRVRSLSTLRADTYPRFAGALNRLSHSRIFDYV